MKALSSVSGLMILGLAILLPSCTKPNVSKATTTRIEKLLAGILDDDVRAELGNSISFIVSNEGHGVRLVGKIVIQGDRIRLECKEMSIDFDAGEFTATKAEFLLVDDDTELRFASVEKVSGRVGSNVISFSGDSTQRIQIVHPKAQGTVIEVKGDASLDLNRENPTVMWLESVTISRIASPSPTPAARVNPLS